MRAVCAWLHLILDGSASDDPLHALDVSCVPASVRGQRSAGEWLWDAERVNVTAGADSRGGRRVRAALVVTVALGIGGWFVAGSGLATTCTNDFSCGTDSCAPCATEHAWVNAGGIGELALAAAVAMIAALSRWHPGWHRAAKVVSGVVILVAVAWFAISTAMARRSF